MSGVRARLRAASEALRRELEVYRLVLRHPRTPRAAKVLLAVAVGYALLPFDLIPDFLPIVGHLDDVIIVPALVLLALKLVPSGIVDECRARAGRWPTTG